MCHDATIHQVADRAARDDFLLKATVLCFRITCRRDATSLFPEDNHNCVIVDPLSMSTSSQRSRVDWRSYSLGLHCHLSMCCFIFSRFHLELISLLVILKTC